MVGIMILMFWTIQEDIRIHSVYEKSACIGREWKNV